MHLYIVSSHTLLIQTAEKAFFISYIPPPHEQVKSKGSKIQPLGKGIIHGIHAKIKYAEPIQQKKWDAQDSTAQLCLSLSYSQESQDNAGWFWKFLLYPWLVISTMEGKA